MKSVSVVVTRYKESNELVKKCLHSLQEQVDCSGEVLFLDQAHDLEIQSFITKLNHPSLSFHYIKIPPNSLSFARNYGVTHAKNRYVLFCDVDCVLEQNWIEAIVATFVEEKVAIVGTKIIPAWETKSAWFHASKYIQEFYSLLSLGNGRVSVPKVIGASFAIDKELLQDEAYFNENLGRKSGTLLGGEETELCARALQNGHQVAYTGRTHANHMVSTERMQLPWLFRRAYYGGYSRAVKGGKVAPFTKTKTTLLDKMSLALILPFYAFGY